MNKSAPGEQGWVVSRAIHPRADLFATASYLGINVKGGGKTENGFGVVVGCRGTVRDGIELNVSGDYSKFGDADESGDWGGELGAVFRTAKALWITTFFGGSWNSDQSQGAVGYGAGLRYYFNVAE